MTDIFDEKNAVEVGFVTWDKVGKKVSGAYIERMEIPAKGIYQPQIGYKLKTDSGIMIAAFGIGKNFVHDCMKQAKLGQLVGFKYTGDFETEASKADKNISPAKTIKVFLGEMILDEVETPTEKEGEDGEINLKKIPF